MIYEQIIALTWLVFVAFWLYSSFGIKKDLNKKSLWKSTWFRITLALIIFGWVWARSMAGNPTAQHLNYPVSGPILSVTGMILCICGVGFAIWARIHIGRNWSPAP